MSGRLRAALLGIAVMCSSCGPATLVAWDGDSQSATVPQLGRATPTYAVEGLDAELVNLADPGDTFDELEAKAASIDEQFRPGGILVVWCGTNDLGRGDDPLRVAARMSDYAQARRARGWKVIAVTALPRTWWQDVPGYEVRRTSFNAVVRWTWPSWADRLVDLSEILEIGVEGDQFDRRFYFDDSTHVIGPAKELIGRRVRAALQELGAHDGTEVPTS